ncbi:hypothetical protein BC826DRAFT_743844 [Russula brevipes]|nr:hypothetical protein BC826DRAFT_743844 [Russula brevipes]
MSYADIGIVRRSAPGAHELPVAAACALQADKEDKCWNPEPRNDDIGLLPYMVTVTTTTTYNPSLPSRSSRPSYDNAGLLETPTPPLPWTLASRSQAFVRASTDRIIHQDLPATDFHHLAPLQFYAPPPMRSDMTLCKYGSIHADHHASVRFV